MLAAARPTYRGDLYGRSALRDSHPAYRRIRDLGPAVWLTRRDMWPIGRFDDVPAALRADAGLLQGFKTLPARFHPVWAADHRVGKQRPDNRPGRRRKTAQWPGGYSWQ
jgi:hypothetical protein